MCIFRPRSRILPRHSIGRGIFQGVISPLSAFLITSPGSLAHASDNPVLLSEEAFLDELPIVLSASRLPQSPSNAPIATTTIDREMIVASGFTEIPDLLRLAPGFIVNYENGYDQAVGYHVLSDQFSRQMQVLVDGRSVYEPSLGGVSWTDLPLAIDDIDRIEVMRGPNASSYGANAFTAIINIITRQAVLDRGLMLKSNVGSDGLTEGYLRYGGAFKNLDYRVTAAYRKNNGFDDRYDDMQIRLITVRGDIQLDLDDTLMFQLGHNSGSKADDDVFDELVPDHKKQTYSQFQQIKLTHTLSADQEFSVQLYHNQNKNINDFNSPPVPALGGLQLYFDERVTADRWDIEFQNILKPANPLRLVWGFGARKDEVAGPTFFNTTDRVDNKSWRIFTNTEYQLSDRTLLNAGIAYEDSDTGGRNISPRASINYHLYKNHTLRASISRAYRDPFVFEEKPDYRFPLPPPNNVLLFDAGNIDSERITSREIGYVGNFPHIHTSVDARYFHENLDKLITFDNIAFAQGVGGTALFFNNLNSARIKGIELSARYKPGNGNQFNISYTHQDIDSTDISGSGNYADAGPENMLNALVIHDFPNGFSASAGFYYLSSMKELSTNDVRPAQYRTDVRLARTLSTASQNMTFAIVVQNLFNRDEDTRLRNNIDRRVYGSVILNFK